jgi:hypothetical protein
VKSRRLQWAEHVAWMRQKRNTYRILILKHLGTQIFGRMRRRWKENMKRDLSEMSHGWN